MNLKYFEKLIIAVVVFIGVVIVTAFIIGTYVNKKNAIRNQNDNSLILESINLF